jgi:sister chromatid cohesion protein DCC1
LSIKGGGKEDEAVLCTSKATYAMKFVSTSNTVLPVPPRVSATAQSTGEKNVEEVHAVATTAGHIELVEIAPEVESLKILLSKRPYKEDVDGDTIVEEEEGLFTWDDLVTRVPASESQLRAALKALGAVEIGRHWRIPDSDFMNGLLEILLLNAVQHDWPLDNLPGMEVVQIMGADNYSPEIVTHCLHMYGSRVDSGLQDDQNNRLREDTRTDVAGKSSGLYWSRSMQWKPEFLCSYR